MHIQEKGCSTENTSLRLRGPGSSYPALSQTSWVTLGWSASSEVQRKKSSLPKMKRKVSHQSCPSSWGNLEFPFTLSTYFLYSVEESLFLDLAAIFQMAVKHIPSRQALHTHIGECKIIRHYDNWGCENS